MHVAADTAVHTRSIRTNFNSKESHLATYARLHIMVPTGGAGPGKGAQGRREEESACTALLSLTIVILEK